MKILVTGAAGFIGFHISNYLLKKKINVIGIDNLDDYYSINLKKNRLSLLKKNKNFKFIKIDISSNRLKKVLKKYHFDIVVHLAAQAGVRYSLINPKKYIHSNIKGFGNLFESINTKNLKKVIYASSSSVYGDTKNFPTKENQKTNPKNIYGFSKVINEQMSEYYFNLLKVPFIGLRFFTIYGEWGRPDMFILKTLIGNEKKKIFYLNNNGNHLRDFTSIKDVLKICDKIIKKKFLNNEIYNVCSNNPQLIKRVLTYIQKEYGNIKYKNIKKNKADVLNTHGDNSKIKKDFKIDKFQNFKNELIELINWYKSVKNIF
mgnify:CR=1 FL=1|tara:strand:+ start:1282 stop:2232 length:951 start_codon:yes stop_codon:yes gene_type:complete